MRHFVVLKTLSVFLTVISFAVTGCTGKSGFEGGGEKKKLEKPAPKQQPQPQPQQPPQQPQPQQPQPQYNPAPLPQPMPMPAPILPPPIMPPPVLPSPVVPDPVVPDPVIPNPQPEPQVQPQPAPQPQPNYNDLNVPQGPSYTNGAMLLPITPIANMEKGYQATNPGFRAVLLDGSGRVAAAGPMTVEAAMNGVKTPSAPGNAYPRMILKVALEHKVPGLQSGNGKLKICLAEDPNSPMERDVACRPLECYQGERPCGFTGRGVDYTVQGENVTVTKWHGSRGDADSPTQAALSAYHAIKDSPFVPTGAWEEAQSPLVLDLNKDKNIDLISFHDQKVSFDLDGNGHKSTTGWVGKNDALLAIDLNGNGQIDNGLELFGEFSHPIAGRKSRAKRTFNDGFSALAQYDSNLDQRIDKEDKVFAKLVLWQDKNTNGITDKGELVKLSQSKIASISLFSEKAADRNFTNMVNDNDIRLLGEYTTQDGHSFQIVDVWFRYAYTNTVAGK